MAREREGQFLGDKWRLDRLIGLGGMAAVYEATHRNGHRAALKVLHPSLNHVPEVRQRFLEESYTANRINHGGVVTIRDDCILDDGTLFLIMDLLEGETLDEFYDRCGCTVVEALHIADAVLDVLISAHALGIIHRDIKPENIFITHDRQIKLLDFGIAWRPDAVTIDGDYALGTPIFMPPEQASCDWQAVDGRTDLWALGATLYLLLTGRYVHSAQSVDEELTVAMTQQVRPVRSIGPSVPEVVAAIVDTALAFDRNDRFADATSMQQAVRYALQLLTADPSLQPSNTQQTVVSAPLAAASSEADLDISDLDLGKPVQLPRVLLGSLAVGTLFGAAVVLIDHYHPPRLHDVLKPLYQAPPALAPDPLGSDVTAPPHTGLLASQEPLSSTSLADIPPPKAIQPPEDPDRPSASPKPNRAHSTARWSAPTRTPSSMTQPLATPRTGNSPPANPIEQPTPKRRPVEIVEPAFVTPPTVDQDPLSRRK
ncbi:MAG TPA: protein kinase [Polyangiaceae bacterium]|nr:protein kinase [Polyangiaceae bacterium]